MADSAQKVNIIWLHGLGASGDDFIALPELLEMPPNVELHLQLPDAPLRPVAINNQMVMPAWFNIFSLENLLPEDTEGLNQATAQIHTLLYASAKETGNAPTFLGGFSQGGALALYAGLCSPVPLRGIIALSAYLPISAQNRLSHASSPLPSIFIAHGAHDEILNIHLGRNAAKSLSEAGFKTDYHEYPMGHTTSAPEWHELSTWLGSQIHDAP